MSVWSLTEPEPGILRLAIDSPGEKQNVLNEAAISELESRVGEIEHRKDARGVVVCSGKSGTFIAGADVKVIGTIPDRETAYRLSRRGQDLFERIANLPIPVVAAITGPCLGGGYELALACDRIVAGEDAKTKIGLPETKIGILPGWGGCVRLPLRIGLVAAFEYILGGKTVDARRAAKDGLVDRLAAPGLVEEAARAMLREGFPLLRGPGFLDRVLTEVAPARQAVVARVERETMAKSKGHYPNLPIAIRTIASAYGQPIAEGLEIEARAFAEAISIPDSVAKNLCRVFFLTERAKSEARARARGATGEIRQAGVLGAGVMGGGIAWALARAGMIVRLRDIRPEALTGALAEIDRILAGEVKRRKATRAEAAAVRGRIQVGTGWEGFGAVDLVVEAVVENLEIKKKVFEEIARKVPAHAILATNTSALPIAEIARASGSPDRVAGLHFFNPVHRMPLVEIIRARETSDATVAALFSVAGALGKTPILCRDAPGFLVNRILLPYLLEGVKLLEEGVGMNEIDGAAESFGMPMGPLRLADEVGLDVCLHVGKFLAASFPDRVRLPAMLERMVETKRFGKKSGEGFYRHVGEDAEPAVDASGVVVGRSRITDRLFRPMVAEAEKILAEGVVESSDTVDLGMLFGTGFPPFRGGLLHWGRTLPAEDLDPS